MLSGEGSPDLLPAICPPASCGLTGSPRVARSTFVMDRAGSSAVPVHPWNGVKGSSQRQVFRAGLAPHLVGLDLERNLLAFGEDGKTGPFDLTDVHKHIPAAVFRLNETKALLAVEPLYCAYRHFSSPKRICAKTRVTTTRFNSILTMFLEEKEPAGAFNKAQRLIEYRLNYTLSRKIQGEPLAGISLRRQLLNFRGSQKHNAALAEYDRWAALIRCRAPSNSAGRLRIGAGRAALQRKRSGPVVLPDSADPAMKRSGVFFGWATKSLPIEAASIECDAHPSFPAPDDVTRPLQWMGWNDERKALGDEKRGYDFERGASLGEVANRAIDRAAAERDRSGLEDAVTRSNSMLIHDGTRDGIRWVANHPRKQKLTGGLQRTN